MTDRSPDNSYGAGTVPDDAEGPEDNLLRHYAYVLRRRVRWVILGLVIGLVAGIASTFLIGEPAPPAVYYKATNTLVGGPTGQVGSNNDSAVSLLQESLVYAQSAELSSKIASKFGLSSQQVMQQLSSRASNSAQYPSVGVTAISADASQAVRMANTAASLIISHMNGTSNSGQIASHKSAQKRLLNLEAEAKQISNEIAQGSPDTSDLQRRYNELQQEITQAQNQVDATEPDPSNRLRTLQPAVPVRINAQGYNYRVSQNVNARNPLNTSTQNSDSGPDFDETDFSSSNPLSSTNRILLGAAAGLILGLVSAFVLEAWDDRVRRREDVEATTGLPVLAEIPRFGRDEAHSNSLAVIDDVPGPVAERYRAARTAVLFTLESHDGVSPKRDRSGGRVTADVSAHDSDDTDDAGVVGVRTPVVMVTSPSPGEGKTTTAANLAATFAEAGLKTLVIDGDFRRPTIRRYLVPTPNLVAPDNPAGTRLVNLEFLAGPHNAATPDVALDALEYMIATWRDAYDIVVLDTPPILTTNDAADLLGAADSVVVVLRSGQTRNRPARRVVSVLTRLQADVLGVVLNGCDRHEMDDYYGYGYGYYLRKGSKSNGSSPESARSDGSGPASSDRASGTRARPGSDADGSHGRSRRRVATGEGTNGSSANGDGAGSAGTSSPPRTAARQTPAGPSEKDDSLPEHSIRD